MKNFLIVRALLLALLPVFSVPLTCAADSMARIVAPLSYELQAGDKISLTLDKAVSPEAILCAKLGEFENIAVERGTDDKNVLVRVPAELGHGQKQESDYRLSLTATTGTTSVPLGGYVFVTVYPRVAAEVKSINDVKENIISYVRPNDTFIVHGTGFFSPTDKIKFTLSDGTAAVTQSVAADGTSFAARFDDNSINPGDSSYEVEMWGRTIGKPSYGHIWIENPDKLVVNKMHATYWALIPVGIFSAALWFLSRGLKTARLSRGPQPGGGATRPLNWMEILLVDPATNTYSLSRLQFLMWLFALIYAYGFVFFARGQVANEWAFPDLAGGQMAFLISLGTLVGSVATTTIVGQKGAGEIHPSPRDLILHGGVVALDRVQQLLWTFVAISLLIRIVYASAGTNAALPKIPDEMLTLMGVSSAGYLAGKAARKQGPVISSVHVDGAGLHISGMGLSVAARVRVGDSEQPRSNIATEIESADKPTEFADVLLVRGITQGMVENTPVTVINPDSQEAKWSPTPPPSTGKTVPPFAKPAGANS